MAKKSTTKKTQPEIAAEKVLAPKKPAARKRAAKTTRPLDQDVQPAQTFLMLDFPQPDETVVSPTYTLRFTVPENTPYVEVSVNDGAWQPCRFAVGHWWFDWADYSAGKHTVRARTTTFDGQEALVERTVRVAFIDADLLK